MPKAHVLHLFGLALGLSLALPVTLSAAPTAEAKPMTYNSPGLITDLGVGLWAWPLPMDWNDDGLMDLVVACTDVPSNGVYVFLNTGEYDPVTRLPLFGPGDNIGPAGRSPQVSYIDGQPMVTTAGNYFPNFKKTGLAEPVVLGDP